MEDTSNQPPQTAVVTVAAGRGTRTGGDLPNQCQMLRSQRVAARSIAVTDTLWRGDDADVTGPRDRSALCGALAPQCPDFEPIPAVQRSYEAAAANDVESVRGAGIRVALVPGDKCNLKLTWPADFARAGALSGG